MQTTVIIDKKGNVVGTYRHPKKVKRNQPTLQIHAGPGQTVHELDLPAEYLEVESADELHRRLKKDLKKLLQKRP